MKSLKNNFIYILSIALFSVSFGYYVILFLYPVLYLAGIRIEILDLYCSTDAAIAPMFICFGLSVVMSVVLIVGFRKNLRGWKDYFFTACAPLFLLACYAVLLVMGHITGGLGNWMISNAVMGSVSFLLIVAYMVGFYMVMHRARKRIQAETDAVIP